MAILTSLQVGNADIVFADLVDIVRCDPGLTFWDPTLFSRKVAYVPQQAAVASSTRILEIINSPVPVYVSGVNYSFVIPQGGAISDSMGVARLRQAPEDPISIWYDISDAAGMHWVVKDKDNQDIYMPRQVILYHELAHAYHDIKGDLPATQTGREIQAMADENAFRSQVGLPQRSSTNHRGDIGMPVYGGLTSPKCSPEKKGWSPGWKCPLAVATAAFESPDVAQIAALRRARAEYRNVSLWTAMIVRPVLELYRNFGPHVARAMQDEPALREAVLWFVVQPACHVLHLAEAYLASDSDSPALWRTVDEALRNYLSAFEQTRWSARVMLNVAEDATAAAAMIDSGAEPARQPSRSEPPVKLYAMIAREILAVKGGTAAAFAWGLEGLASFLRSAAEAAGGSPSAADDLLWALGSWVPRIPLPSASELRIADAKHELSVLASRVFTRAETRAQFARHLLAHWGEASSAELKIVLRDAGYPIGSTE